MGLGLYFYRVGFPKIAYDVFTNGLRLQFNIADPVDI